MTTKIVLGCSMGKNVKKSVIAAFALLVCSICFAGQISVQVVQHNKAIDYVSEQSLIVEDELLNGFFDKGYIVTNSVARVSDSSETDSDLFYEGFGEAFDGSSDVFVQVKVYFTATEKKTSADIVTSRLDHIDWVMINVTTGKVIKESSVQGIANKPGTDESVRLVSGKLISEIQKAL